MMCKTNCKKERRSMQSGFATNRAPEAVNAVIAKCSRFGCLNNLAIGNRDPNSKEWPAEGLRSTGDAKRRPALGNATKYDPVSAISYRCLCDTRRMLLKSPARKKKFIQRYREIFDNSRSGADHTAALPNPPHLQL